MVFCVPVCRQILDVGDSGEGPLQIGGCLMNDYGALFSLVVFREKGSLSLRFVKGVRRF